MFLYNILENGIAYVNCFNLGASSTLRQTQLLTVNHKIFSVPPFESEHLNVKCEKATHAYAFAFDDQFSQRINHIYKYFQLNGNPNFYAIRRRVFLKDLC